MVLLYSIYFEGAAVYDMVAMAYQFPVVGAFWPLVCGLYWKRTTRQGAYCSIVVGGIVWFVLTATSLGEVFPSVLGGFIASGLGMVVGSLLPTTGNREYLEAWRRRQHEEATAASPESGALPAALPA